MKRSGYIRALLPLLLMGGHHVRAQDSLEMIDKDINQVQQEHQEAASKNLGTFLSVLESASASPEDAVKLYQQSGGLMPEAAPVRSRYAEETPSEREARQALDQAMLGQFSGALELHCGLMRMAALFVTSPKASTLPGEWTAWLKSAAQTYPQVAAPLTDSRQAGSPNPNSDRRNRRNQETTTRDARLGDNATPGTPDDSTAPTEDTTPAPPPRLDVAKPIRDLAMSESSISAYLGFNQWGKSEQADWNVSDIPKLYRRDVLEPLRVNPTAAVLPAWDAYIAMMNADEPDPDKWTQQDYPPLEFDRGSDDFASGPSAEKLETLVNLIKANPGYPHLDDWISRVHEMLATLKAQQQAKAVAVAPAPGALPPIQPDPPASSPAATNASPAP